MAKAKATERIYLRDGSISTIGEALDAGILVVRKSENFVADLRPHAAGRNPMRSTVRYFADFKDEPGHGWEITPGLYKSRTGQAVVPQKESE